jgi:hypothetical protein
VDGFVLVFLIYLQLEFFTDEGGKSIARIDKLLRKPSSSSVVVTERTFLSSTPKTIR